MPIIASPDVAGALYCHHWPGIISAAIPVRTIALVLTTLVDVYLNDDRNPLERRSSLENVEGKNNQYINHMFLYVFGCSVLVCRYIPGTPGIHA